MIQPLRRYHFWTWITMAVVLTTAFIVSLVERQPTTPINAGVRWSQLK